MLEFLHALLLLDTKTMLAMLFWGNLVSALLIITFRFTSRSKGEWRLSGYYILSRVCLAMAYFCLFFRGSLPVFLSVNYGNTLLLTGLCLEALSLLSASRVGGRGTYVAVGFTLLCSISIFNIVEALHPDASLRVLSASVCVFAVLAVPCVKLLRSGGKSVFQRVVGVCYALFVSLLIPRALHALTHQVDVHSSFFIQTLTFLAMDILMIFSLLAYLLIVKENAEQHINMLARIDVLTGLSNRMSFFEDGSAVFREHRDNRHPLAALLVNVSDFKRINNMYGYNFGDQVLVRLGALIKDNLRACDLCARHGAAEFALLLPRSERECAGQLAQRIRNGAAECFFPQHAEFRLQLDIGYAQGLPGEQAGNLEDFIIRAERNMHGGGPEDATAVPLGGSGPLKQRSGALNGL